MAKSKRKSECLHCAVDYVKIRTAEDLDRLIEMVRRYSPDMGDSYRPLLRHLEDARLAVESIEHVPAPRLFKQPTWLTPYFDVWKHVYGDNPDSISGLLGRIMKPLEKKYSKEQILRHFENYLRSTSVAYVNLAKFAASFTEWEHARPQPNRGVNGRAVANGRAATQEQKGLYDGFGIRIG